MTSSKSAFVPFWALFALSACTAGSYAQVSTPALRSSRGLFLVKDAPKPLPKTELGAFAAGCFWGVEQAFRTQKGIIATAVGFSGGHVENPSYERVCQHDTGHAETVEIEFDPKVVSYDALLQLFWDIHDPTTVDRQGPDVGDQYRSVIFYETPAQKAAAIASRDRLQNSGELGKAKIVTQIVPAQKFYFAEDHHQQYVEKGGIAACHFRRHAK